MRVNDNLPLAPLVVVTLRALKFKNVMGREKYCCVPPLSYSRFKGTYRVSIQRWITQASKLQIFYAF